MKILIIIATFLLFSSCGETTTFNIQETPYGKVWKIPLDNNLGIVEIVLPKHLDTFFKWIQYSDCGEPCATVDYRIQPKSLSIFKETGFYYPQRNDSVEQFTIKHSKVPKPWPFTDTSLIKQYSAKLKSEVFENEDYKYIIDTLLNVDKQKFAVIAFRTFDTAKKTTVQILNAATAVDGDIIEFFFEYRKSYQDTLMNNFLENSLNALKSIRISNGNRHLHSLVPAAE